MNRFGSEKDAFGFCDRCGFRYPLRQLKTLTIRGRLVNMRVCPECWEMDHPQLRLGQFPIFDPQALRNPRVDSNIEESRLAFSWNPINTHRIRIKLNSVTVVV